MSPPAFSVVVPTFDRPELLDEALRSVATQTLEDFECIVVDDHGSEPVDLPDDPRFRVLRLERSSGPAAARNAGLEAATGRFVTFLDDDDLFTPDRLRRALELHEHAPIVVGSSTGKDDPGGRIARLLTGDVRAEILTFMVPHAGCASVRRDLLPRFDGRYAACEDVEWWLRLVHAGRVASIGRPVYLVRRHPGVRHGYGPMTRLLFTLAMLEHHGRYFRTARRARAFRLLRASITATALGDRRLGRRLALQSFADQPGWRPLYHAARALRPSTDRIETESPLADAAPAPAVPVRIPLRVEDCRRWTKHRSGGLESKITPVRWVDRALVALAHRFGVPWRGYVMAAGLRLLRRREVPLSTVWADLVAPHDDHALLHPYFDEPLETAVWARCFTGGEVTLDVGANRGWFTLLSAALAGSEGRTLAFEPDPRARRQLERSLAVNPDLAARVTVRDVALGEACGEARFSLEAQSSLSHLAPPGEQGPAESATETVTLGTVDSEVEAAGLHRIDRMKIDVEGAEVRVLQGARGTLERHRPAVLVEAEPRLLKRFGRTVEDVAGAFPDGYRVYWLSWSAGGLIPFEEGPPARGRNLFGLPEGFEHASLLPFADSDRPGLGARS